MIIYIYDLKTTNTKNKKAYNCLKRNFYYSFNKHTDRFERRTKSVIIIDEKHEKEFDRFFMQWQGFIELYKIRTGDIEKVLG